MTAPLVPPALDLRDFPFMPVDVRRLLTSETWLTATGDEKAAAMTLWLESWHQVPAGSLPDNDRMLAILSQAGGRWSKVKVAAMRGWVKCEDGRLYHPVVCEKATEAWERKQNQRQRTEAARLARLNRTATRGATGSVTEPVTDDVTASKGQGQGQGHKSSEPNGSAASAPGVANSEAHQPEPQPSQETEYFKRCRAMFGEKAGGSIGAKLLAAKDKNVALARAALEVASTKENPREYVFGCIRDPPNGAQRSHDPRL